MHVWAQPIPGHGIVEDILPGEGYSGHLGCHRHMEETLYLFPRRALSQMRDESFFTVVANCKQLYCPEEIRISLQTVSHTIAMAALPLD